VNVPSRLEAGFPHVHCASATSAEQHHERQGQHPNPRAAVRPDDYAASAPRARGRARFTPCFGHAPRFGNARFAPRLGHAPGLGHSAVEPRVGQPGRSTRPIGPAAHLRAGARRDLTACPVHAVPAPTLGTGPGARTAIAHGLYASSPRRVAVVALPAPRVVRALRQARPPCPTTCQVPRAGSARTANPAHAVSADALCPGPRAAVPARSVLHALLLLGVAVVAARAPVVGAATLRAGPARPRTDIRPAPVARAADPLHAVPARALRSVTSA
jgi:hypothetical protein